MSDLKKSQYEPLLNEELSCWRCGQAMQNMHTLKTHLQEEWDKAARKAKAKSVPSEKVIEEPIHDETSANPIERDNGGADKPEQETI
jgi:aprataxin